jgi:hypothetical protein
MHLKGKIITKKKPNNEVEHLIEYVDDAGAYLIDVDYSLSIRYGGDVNLIDGADVEFYINEISTFPYRLAVIVANDGKPTPTSSIPPPKPKKKYHINIAGSSFYEEIICDDATSSSSGFYTFYNVDSEGSRTDIAYYPIDRTIVTKIEYNVTE